MTDRRHSSDAAYRDDLGAIFALIAAPAAVIVLLAILIALGLARLAVLAYRLAAAIYLWISCATPESRVGRTRDGLRAAKAKAGDVLRRTARGVRENAGHALPAVAELAGAAVTHHRHIAHVAGLVACATVAGVAGVMAIVCAPGLAAGVGMAVALWFSPQISRAKWPTLPRFDIVGNLAHANATLCAVTLTPAVGGVAAAARWLAEASRAHTQTQGV